VSERVQAVKIIQALRSVQSPSLILPRGAGRKDVGKRLTPYPFNPYFFFAFGPNGSG
jgi:hypothetical protein